MILAGDVDKIFIPFDRSSSFSQSRPVVKGVGTATDKHGFSRIGIKTTSAKLEEHFYPCESVFIRGYFLFGQTN